MNSMPEIKLPLSRPKMPMPVEHEELMQQHLRDEHLPEAVMPATTIIANSLRVGDRLLERLRVSAATSESDRGRETSKSAPAPQMATVS
jgi:hypothetical protein